MIKKIIEYKFKLEQLKENHKNIDKSLVSKLLVMANLAELKILSGTEVSDQEMKEYFEGQAYIGRYFCDWQLDWVAEGYFEIVQFIKTKRKTSI